MANTEGPVVALGAQGDPARPAERSEPKKAKAPPLATPTTSRDEAEGSPLATRWRAGMRGSRRVGWVLGLVTVAALAVACAGDERSTDEATAVAPDTETDDTETDAEALGDASTDDTAEEPGTGTQDGCALTSAAVVEEVSGGTVVSQELDDLGVCTFGLEGAEVSSVFVGYYGTAAEWDAVVEGYQESRGPVMTVDGIGDEAFHPADAGENELVVFAGDTGFAVFTFEDAAGLVRQLAERIASEAG